MKVVLWVLAITGLVGPCALAAFHLLTIRAPLPTRSMPDLPPGVDASEPMLVDVAILGPGFALPLSTSAWPSVLVLSGAMLFLAGLFFLIPKQDRAPVADRVYLMEAPEAK